MAKFESFRPVCCNVSDACTVLRTKKGTLEVRSQSEVMMSDDVHHYIGERLKLQGEKLPIAM